MGHEDLNEIRAKIVRAQDLIKEAMESGLPLIGGEHERELTALWEEFFSDLLIHIKLKSRETRHNLLPAIYRTFYRVWLRR